MNMELRRIIFYGLVLMFTLTLDEAKGQGHSLIDFNGRDFPIREYCDSEKFSADCRKGEVVIITFAKYGRHSIGDCVEKNYGNLGCEADVLLAVDALCSGLQKCEFEIDDDTFQSYQPCPKDFKSHLRVGYQCIPVHNPAQPCRKIPADTKASMDRRTIPVTSSNEPTKFISSDIARSTGCGSTEFPWILKAPEGRRIELSIVDFSLNGTQAHSPTGNPPNNGVCLVYASVRDGSKEPGVQRRSSTICGRVRPRVRHEYSSSTSRVELRILQSNAMMPLPANDIERRPRFLISYRVIGCMDPALSDGSWVKRLDDDTAIVGCAGRPEIERWRLVCEDNHWKGQLGNCTSEDAAFMEQFVRSVQGLPFGLSVALIVAIAFVVSCFILLIGICIITRRNTRKRNLLHAQTMAAYSQSRAPLQNQQPITDPKSKYHIIKSNQSDNMYTDSAGGTDLYTLRTDNYGVNSIPRRPENLEYRRQGSNNSLGSLRSIDYYPSSEHIYEYPNLRNMGITFGRQDSMPPPQYFDIEQNHRTGPPLSPQEVPGGLPGRASGSGGPSTGTGDHVHMIKPSEDA